MRKYNVIVALLAITVLSASVHGDPSPQAISVAGAVSNPGDWTVARMKSDLASQIVSIQYSSHGQQHTSAAVPLVSVLQSAGMSSELKMVRRWIPNIRIIRFGSSSSFRDATATPLHSASRSFCPRSSTKKSGLPSMRMESPSMMLTGRLALFVPGTSSRVDGFARWRALP